MPIFEYKCSLCGKVTETIVPLRKREDKTSCVCGGVAIVIPSTTGYRRDMTVVEDNEL